MSSLFLSYSHQDEALRQRLEVHLAGLKRDGTISVWHDRRIAAGDAFAQRIDEHLEQADVILLLVSADFLASDYCNDVEMQRALERHAGGSARVIPVILRPCDWKHPPLASLLAVPTDGKPITSWPNEDEAFLDVVQQIRDALPASRQPVAGRHPSTPSRAEFAPADAPPRSSNLRVRKKFSDADKDRFLDEAFEYMERFFESSLDELSARNPGVEGRFKQLDGTRFTAVIYEAGATQAQCTINLGSPFGGRGISYSDSVGGAGNSYNEMLSVENDEQHLFLKAMGMRMMGDDRDVQLSHEGAAEYFWSMLIEPLQQ
jgi:hypothetical protein